MSGFGMKKHNQSHKSLLSKHQSRRAEEENTNITQRNNLKKCMSCESWILTNLKKSKVLLTLLDASILSEFCT